MAIITVSERDQEPVGASIRGNDMSRMSPGYARHGDALHPARNATVLSMQIVAHDFGNVP